MAQPAALGTLQLITLYLKFKAIVKETLNNNLPSTLYRNLWTFLANDLFSVLKHGPSIRFDDDGHIQGMHQCLQLLGHTTLLVS